MTSPLTFPSPPDSSGPASRGRVVAVVVVGLLVMGALAIVLFSGGDDDTGSDDTVTSDTSSDDASDTSDADTTGEDGANDAGGDTTGEDGANDSTDPLPVGPTTGELARATVQLIQLEADGAFGCFSGSGSVVSPEGRILTNAHVVWNDPTCPYDLMGVMITRSADEPPELAYIADVIGFDDRLDLAVLQITTDLGGVPVDELALPFVITGDSGSVQLGDPLRILGYPGIGGDTITFTEGAVSGFVSEQGISDTRAWIKTDATIAGGNSGGMAVNEAGELIGVPTQAGAGDAATTDCRVIEDTNGDGSIDDNDSCIPIGGFINGLRPVNLAAELLSGEGLASLDPVTPSGPVGGFDPESVLIEQLVFTDSIVDDQPVGTVGSLASGATDLCVHWSYEGMADGLRYDTIWRVDGELDSGGSSIGATWVGGGSGTWWVCIFNDDLLADGLYEFELAVEGETLATESIFVGGDRRPVVLTIANNSDTAICYVQISPTRAGYWGPDELGATEVIAAGTRRDFPLVTGLYDVRYSDCDVTVLDEVSRIRLGTDQVISYDG